MLAEMLSTSLLSFCTFFFLLLRASDAAYSIDDSSSLGRRFDGIGGISGGGATSKLLVGYPLSQRNQILDYLFLPNFAASLQILKVEIGGDAQSTDGTESSHMHESWDENYKRGYEWWLMVEAKKRNPAIKLYGLPWAFPGWVGRGSGNPYKYPEDTATYVVKWVQAAKKYYNLDIDYLGIWNERNYDKVYVETLRSILDKNGFTNVSLVVGDDGWEVSPDVLNDTTFAKVVNYIGCHYPGTTTSPESIKTGKPLWASEDYSTFNDNVGAGCWARILNQNYVNGYMTSTISWNLIASYYEGLPYGRDGLMTAQEPWSGHYVVDNPIWITAHTTQFTAIGWTYLDHGHGVGHLEGGGSYVSLTNPDKTHLTIIIETMSHDHSVCIRPGLPAYNVTAQQAEFMLSGSFMHITELHVWKTQLTYNGIQSDTVFSKQRSLKPYMGLFMLALEPDQIYTLTTMSGGMKGDYGQTPQPRPFPFPYSDNFDGYDEYAEAYNFAPQSGVWEVIDSSDPAHGKINRQVILHDPIYWCATRPATMNLGGDQAWADVFIKLDIYIPTLNGSGGAYLAARVDRGGCDADAARGLFFTIYTTDSSFVVSSDIAMTKILAIGNITTPLKNNTWYTMSLIVRGDDAIGLIDNNQPLFQVAVPTDIKSTGFVAYGTPVLGLSDFDNLIIQSPNSEDVHFYQPQPNPSKDDVHFYPSKSDENLPKDVHFNPSQSDDKLDKTDIYESQRDEISENGDIHFYPSHEKSAKNDVHFYRSNSYKNSENKNLLFRGFKALYDEISYDKSKKQKPSLKLWQKL